MTDKDAEVAGDLQAQFDAETDEYGHGTAVSNLKAEPSTSTVRKHRPDVAAPDHLAQGLQKTHISRTATVDAQPARHESRTISIDESLAALVSFSKELRRVRCVRCKKTVLPANFDPRDVYYSREYVGGHSTSLTKVV